MLKALFHHLKIFFSGSKGYEKEWEHRRTSGTLSGDWNEKDPDWVKGYWASTEHPHRAYLVETIADLNPASVLEIGCNCGPNLRMLARKLPDCRLTGIDINNEAVEKGNEWLRIEGIPNIHLMVGRADDLSTFSDDSFDVVFTDALLIYIGPDKINSVIREMVRVTRKKIVLFEWQKNNSDCFDTLGIRHYILRRGLWAWNYQGKLKQFNKVNQISFKKIPSGMWSDPYWEKYGALIQGQMYFSDHVDDPQ